MYLSLRVARRAYMRGARNDLFTRDIKVLLNCIYDHNSNFQCKFPPRLYVCRLKSKWRRLIWFHSIHFVKSFFAFALFNAHSSSRAARFFCELSWSNMNVLLVRKFFTISRTEQRNFSFFIQFISFSSHSPHHHYHHSLADWARFL